MLMMKTHTGSALVFAILALPLTMISGEVLLHHLNGTRDGAYVDPLMTRKAAATIHQDRTFNAPVQGPVYGQPLYVDNGPSGKAALVVATEGNTVLALDAATGAQIWTKTLGNPVQRSQLPCGNIDPLGITGTPIIDPNDRTIYVAAMTTPNGGRTKATPRLCIVAGGRLDSTRMAGKCFRHEVWWIVIQSIGAEPARCPASQFRHSLRPLWRPLGRLRRLSWLGHRHSPSRSEEPDRLGDRGPRRRSLGTGRNSNRWPFRFRRYRKHLRCAHLDGWRSDHPPWFGRKVQPQL
jgi:hypothetical protein